MLKHIKKLFELEGEVVGARKARSAAIRYLGGFKNAAKIRNKCSFISSFDDVLNLVSFARELIYWYGGDWFGIYKNRGC